MVTGQTAYSYVTDGVVLPVRVAGHVALDFCNTLAGWGEPEPKDYLRGYAELVLWTRDAGLVDPEAAERLRIGAEPAVLARALRLREALYETVLKGSGWETVAERADLPVLAVAREAAEFLLSDHAPVRACPGRQCGWLFLDPRRRRRWCSMATCGNRAKQRRFGQRARLARSF